MQGGRRSKDEPGYYERFQYQGADVNNYFGISQRGDYEVYHGQFVAGLEQKFGGHSSLNVVAAFDFSQVRATIGSDARSAKAGL